MAFRLVVVTGYWLAATFPQFNGLPVTGSVTALDEYSKEEACVADAVKYNLASMERIEADTKELHKALAVPRDTVAKRRKAETNLDKLSQKDWDEISLERKKITDAMAPIPIKKAFCLEIGLWAK
jgi:hypothetical protein